MKFLSLLILTLAGALAQAAVVQSCEGLDSIGNLVSSTRVFQKNSVKIAKVAVEQPEEASVHLLIFVNKPEMGVDCFAISAAASTGFGDLNFDAIKVVSDSDRTMMLEIPATVYGNGRLQPESVVRVRVDRTAGDGRVFIE